MELCSPPKSGLTVTLEHLNTSPYSALNRLLDTSTPALRKTASKATPAERQFAFDTACQCVEESLQSKGPELQHARYFRAGGFNVLRECLQTDLLDESFQASLSTSGASQNEAEFAESSFQDLHLRDTASSMDQGRRKLGIWNKIKRRLSTESPGRCGPPESPILNSTDGKFNPGYPHSRGPSVEEKGFSFVSINVERSFMLLVAAAPNKGEVQHWVWLLRNYMQKCSLENVHVMLSYLARISRSIAAEEEWLRLLALELTPVLAVLRENDLPSSSQAMLRSVADRAMQVGEDAILGFRSHRSSRLENSSLLAAAVRLHVLVAKCASAADAADMGGLFEELLSRAAHQRFRALLTKHAGDSGLPSPNPAADATAVAARAAASLAAVCDQLVQDISDDAECYQAAFPPECAITLPAISCRVYCHLVKAELGNVLSQNLEPGAALFALCEAVLRLEQTVQKWAPASLGPEGCLSGEGGRPLFLPHIEPWVRGVRAKLMQWSMRLLKEEEWQRAVAGGVAGVRCSPSLIELFRALCAVVEDHAFLWASHAAFARLLERTLTKVVLVHVAGLERLCQAEMPAKQGRQLSGQLRSLASLSQPAPAPPFHPSPRLCMLLNDLREARSQQAELSGAVRSRLPPGWWGSAGPAEPHNGGDSLRLGDRFKLCQVEIERRYAAALHHAIKRTTQGMAPVLSLVLAEPSSRQTAGAYLLTECLDEHLSGLAPVLDTRVMRRVSRELWNTLGGVLHEDLLNCQEGQSGGAAHHSLGNVAPRIQHIDAVLKHLSGFLVRHKLTGLTQEDEPEKVAKLRRVLALFMREDEGQSIESI